jgi:hypothetical protein
MADKKNLYSEINDITNSLLIQLDNVKDMQNDNIENATQLKELETQMIVLNNNMNKMDLRITQLELFNKMVNN